MKEEHHNHKSVISPTQIFNKSKEPLDENQMVQPIIWIGKQPLEDIKVVQFCNPLK